MNNAQTQDWRRTPRLPNGLYVGLYSILRTRLNVEHSAHTTHHGKSGAPRCAIPADSLRSEPRTPPHEPVLTSTLHASS
jgi:hypothetical protein